METPQGAIAGAGSFSWSGRKAVHSCSTEQRAAGMDAAW